jgi:hypothetical protein
MNERIRELADQAGFILHKVDGLTDFYIFNKEKFAELIVRESIVDFYRRYLDLESEEDITEQVNRYVKDNFGVEE